MTNAVKIRVDKTAKAGIHRIRLDVAGYTFTLSGYHSEEDACRIADTLKDILEGKSLQKGKKQ